MERTGLSAPTINAALADLERSGTLSEMTGRRRGLVFAYRGYLAILNEATDPLPPLPESAQPKIVLSAELIALDCFRRVC